MSSEKLSQNFQGGAPGTTLGREPQKAALSKQAAGEPITLGPYPDKVGREELLEVLELWQFSPATRQQLIKLIQADPNFKGPNLFRYYNERSVVVRTEKAFSQLIGTSYCLATNSCTSALVSAYRALGIGAGAEVIVPAFTFSATATAAAAANAVPVIVECDDTLNLDVAAAEAAITPRTKAIAAVHICGSPAQMDAIMDLARRKGLPVVEDVAQAGGGSFKGKRLGSLGTMGCFSFDYFKIMVSGEGGFLTTNDEWLFTRATSWHDSSGCWRPDRFIPETKPGELFSGENYRMSELQGAVALAQIRKCDTTLGGFRRAKARIKAGIEKFPGVSFRRHSDEAGDAASCLIMYLPSLEAKRQAVRQLQAQGVPATLLHDPEVPDWHTYCDWDYILERKAVAADGLPWSALPAAQQPRYSRMMCPRTMALLARAFSISINCNFSDADCDAIAARINQVFHQILK